MANLPIRRSKQIGAFLEKAAAARGRLILGLDATASRQPSWDQACQLQSEMFEEAAKIGGLEVQLVFYRGANEFSHSEWTVNARELAVGMSRIVCAAGETQIGRVLAHARNEHAQSPVGAVLFVGDACEEVPARLYDAASRLGVPVFCFQEGDDEKVEQTFREIARLTKGAYCKLAPGAAREFAEVLRAVAAFATGGLTALADLRSSGAQKLLQQLK
jgi:hypothetical protein